MSTALKSPLMWLRIGLVAGLGVVVMMAFRVSWNALRDVALAIGADDQAATLYPFVVDGLMVVALVASLYLVGRDKAFALCVLGGYTVASLVLNYIHGLLPELHESGGEMVRLAGEDWVHYGLVFIASALPVGSIYFGSDLVAKVLHHRPAAVEAAPVAQNAPVGDVGDVARSGSDRAHTLDASPAGSDGEPVSESALETAESAPTGAPAAVVESTPTRATAAPTRTVAESTGTRSRRAVSRVPEAAKSAPRPTRSFDELVDEARTLTLPDGEVSAEKIRLSLRVGAKRAREIRDLLQAERGELARRVESEDSPEIPPTDRHQGLHLVTDADDDIPDSDLADGESTGTDD